MLKSELQVALTGALIALGGAVTTAYSFWRKLKADMREDRSSDRAYDDLAALLEHYKRETREAQAQIERQRLEIETISKERNEAVQAAGRLEASVEYLKEQVDDMRKIIEQQQIEIKRLTGMVERIADANE